MIISKSAPFQHEISSVGLKPVIQIPREPPESNVITEIQRKETKNRNPGGICLDYRSLAGQFSAQITYKIIVFWQITLLHLTEQDLLVILVSACQDRTDIKENRDQKPESS